MDKYNSTSILKGDNLTIGYKKGHKIIKEVHKNISFNLYPGELTSLIGPNGVGKSTLLRSVTNSQPLISGQIFLYDKPITIYSEKKISRFLSLVLTERGFADDLKVEEIVSLGRYPHTGFFGRLSKDDINIIETSLSDIGISDKQHNYFGDLSDGEKQKVMIAKALAQQSPVIILDEPTSFLDVTSRIEIINILRRLAKEKNKAILLSTHDIEQALYSSDKLWLLSRKNGLKCGTPEDLIFNNQLDDLFENNNVSFDKYTGSFKLKRNNEKFIKVTAEEPYLFWVNNLIERLGYTKTTDSDNEPVVCHIIVENAQNIKLISSENVLNFNSFEELRTQLTLL